MIDIHTEILTRRFGGLAAIDALSLNFAAGAFTALLGPSGCGKSTLLRLVAGFEAPDEGSIAFGDKIMADPHRLVPPEHRQVGVVFQSYALWPHMDVAGNVGYPLKMRKLDAGSSTKKISDVLEIVGLSGFQARRVDELSGGQRQRVALARCLVADTPVILFDEPLANLDMHLRASMIETFREVANRTRATIIYVTHDQAEALALADTVAVLDHGKLQQAGTPQAVYDAPANAMVAGFVGKGAILPADVKMGEDGRPVATIAGVSVSVRGDADTGAAILIRPEALRLAETGLPASVVSSTYRGPVYDVRLRLVDGGELELDSRRPMSPGDAVHIAIDDAWIVPR